MEMSELIQQAIAGDLYGSIDDTAGGRILGSVEPVQTAAGLRWHIGCADGYYEVPPDLSVPQSATDVYA